MSVLKSKRETSKLEFLKTLRKIEMLCLQIEMNKPKKFKHIIHDCLFSNSVKAYEHAKIANSIYPAAGNDDFRKDDIRGRRMNMKQSLNYNQALISQIEVLYAQFSNEIIRNSELEQLSQLTLQADYLLRGVIKSDRDRFK